MSTLTDFMILQGNACEGGGTNVIIRAGSSLGRVIWNATKRFFNAIGGFFRAIGEAYWDGCRWQDNRSARHSPYDYTNVRGIL